MKVLFIASEVAPFSKTGGLADVAAALPAELARRGHHVMVVTPLYAQVNDPRIVPLGKEMALRFPFGEVAATLKGFEAAPGLQLVFLDQPAFFARPGLYQEGDVDYPDNHRRFAFFSIGALTAAQLLGFVPDVVHLNDWQTGLAAAALGRGYRGTSLARARSVFTVHNLAYQGTFPKVAMDELALPWELFTPAGLEFHDELSFLKAGLAYADAITTVSKTYAGEIQTPEGGCGLDGLLRSRKASLHGILNGVDYALWSPEADPHLPATYSAQKMVGKRRCKLELLERFALTPPSSGGQLGPVFGVISRLAEQKGIDLLLEALPKILDRDLSVVVLGNGEARLERGLQELQQRYPTKVGLKLGFDTGLAHLIEAGSDFFVMPSWYEPCGLNQMYSLRYGTVPIVRATGGLEDTVIDLSLPEATGIKFSEYSPAALGIALRRALQLYPDQEALGELRRRGMACDFSWAVAARQYESLYASLLTTKR